MAAVGVVVAVAVAAAVDFRLWVVGCGLRAREQLSVIPSRLSGGGAATAKCGSIPRASRVA